MSTKRRTFSQIIKADPGYYALDLICNPHDESFRVHREPVIAWFIAAELVDDPDTFITPVCQEQLSGLSDGAILRPDGKVVVRGKRQWDTFEAYERHVHEVRRNLLTASIQTREGVDHVSR